MSRNRLIIALLRSQSIADHFEPSHTAPGELIAAIEDPARIPFDECVLRIMSDLEQRGVEVGSKQHLAGVNPLPPEPAIRSLVQTVKEDRRESAVVTPLDLLEELMRDDPALASRLAAYGFGENGI